MRLQQIASTERYNR